MELLPGTTLGGRYLVDTVLGRGGFATVYAARHLQLGSRHAIKVLHAGAKDDQRGRLLAEGRLQARLNHPNVVRVTDLVELPDGVALVMDQIDGETLMERLERGPLGRSEALQLIEGVLEGAVAAHALGLVHRDLKPSNILLTADGCPKIADFGLARANDPAARGAVTQAGIGLGSPGYMAPEAYLDVASVDARADVFALGAILYELLAGERAFPVGVPWFQLYQRACNASYTPIDAVVPDLPLHWVDTIHDALDPNPSVRPASVAALAARWRGPPGGASPRPPAPPAPLAATIPLARPARSDPTLDLGAVEVGPHRLPSERDTFVGRGADLAALHERLLEGRLVSLLGIGGTGKTRLALHYARSRLREWPGGVWFCDLSEARSQEGVLHAVGAALDLPLQADPASQIGHALAERGRCLLILDNFEQVVAVAPATVGRWLDRAAGVRFLVTSRERLGLPGEQVLALDPLDDPAAVALFLERARAVHPSVTAEPATLEALVRRLDGLPLAIELAASRCRLMTPSQLLARLNERFKLLSAPVGRSRRHGTLRAMLDWSWDLLRPEERAALAQLSVFAGGFTLEAAEAVLEAGEAWAPDLVQALVDRSLLRLASHDRFDLLAAVQEYASEKLDAQGDRAEVEHRHGLFFARFGADGEIEALEGPDGLERRRALARERDNLQGACRRAGAAGRGDVAVATLEALWALLMNIGPAEPVVKLAAELRAGPPLHDRARAAVSLMAGHAERLGGGSAAVAEAAYQVALALAQRASAPDLRFEARVLHELGRLWTTQGRFDAARGALERGLVLARDAGELSQASALIGSIGNVYSSEWRLDEARERFEQVLRELPPDGNQRVRAVVLGNLGVVHRRQGRLDEARRCFEAALALQRRLGLPLSEVSNLINLGRLHFQLGRLGEALTCLDSALHTQRTLGIGNAEEACLVGLAVVHRELGELERARGYLDEAEPRARANGARPYLLSILIARVGVAVAQGALDEAVAALAEAESIAPSLRIPPASEEGLNLDGARSAVQRALADR
jgi:predicted ATPase